MRATELSTIVQAVSDAPDLESALDIVVKRVSKALGTEVCSVYLRDPENDGFVFSANQGLNPDLVGKANLGPGEGLVGLVAERGERINTDHAEAHPRYRFLPGLGEEHYHSFLGVPIIHRRKTMGVLVVQQKASRKFNDDEEGSLSAVASQLAAAIDHARIIGTMHSPVGPNTGVDAQFDGVAASPGIAIGTAIAISPGADLDNVPSRRCSSPSAEKAYFHDCLGKVRDELREMGARLSSKLAKEERALFDAFVAMLEDRALAKEIDALIDDGEWAQGALAKVMLAHVNTFEQMDDPYLRERAVDIKDLGRRVLSKLQDQDDRKPEIPERAILVGHQLTATVLAEVPADRLVGLVTVRGSTNSHVAILARAMGIPTVMGAEDLPFSKVDGEELVVDGFQGKVYYRPSPGLREHFESIHLEQQSLSEDLYQLRDEPCISKDGRALPLWVNTGLSADVSQAVELGANGVGLYRTEVPFVLRERFPSEKEQCSIYQSQLKAFAPMAVTMRTLDVGGDKPLPYLPINEDNPFLGWRGIRITLDNPDIMLHQVRAMIRASIGYDNLRILLPMISSVAELELALHFIRQAHNEICKEEELDLPMPKIGAMIEVPAAVYQARNLAERVDFLSVGSNDLTQYLLAVDRNNSRVSSLYKAFHPSVLKALKMVVDEARGACDEICLCGELAGDPIGAALLLGMGYDSLSMNATSLLRVKAVIRALDYRRLHKLVDEVIHYEHAEDVLLRMRDELAEAGLDKLVAPLYQKA